MAESTSPSVAASNPGLALFAWIESHAADDGQRMPGHFTVERQKLCIQAAMQVEHIGCLLVGPMNKAARQEYGEQLRVIGLALSGLLCRGADHATAEERDRLAQVGAVKAVH